MSRPAIFLDRDGTLIEDPGYLNDPVQIRLLPGVREGLRRLRDAGYLLVVVTNQSGIARGLITEEQYRAVAAGLETLVLEGGASLDAQYHCPHLPEISGACECRKPGLLLFQQAIAELDLDPHWSWWLGDRERDVSPASALGGRAILIGPAARSEGSWLLAADFAEAVEVVLSASPG